jgi:hypothetical protein
MGRNFYRTLVGSMKEKDKMEDTVVDGSTVLGNGSYSNDMRRSGEESSGLG